MGTIGSLLCKNKKDISSNKITESYIDNNKLIF